MELTILTLQNATSGKQKLPAHFSEEIRHDLIKRAVEAAQANARQKYGADPRAGKKSSAKLSRRRRDYKASYGHGISRVPRKTLARNGAHFTWVGAYAPGTVGGRRAFPPKPAKNWNQKINNQERKKAIRSSLSATIIPDLVRKRGHIIPQTYPFLLSNDFETLTKTSTVIEALTKLGFEQELQRTNTNKIRAGKGKMRGRKHTSKKGPLLVVSEKSPVIPAARNIPGIDVTSPAHLNAQLLAPGAALARATLFTQNALEQLQKQKLYL